METGDIEKTKGSCKKSQSQQTQTTIGSDPISDFPGTCRPRSNATARVAPTKRTHYSSLSSPHNEAQNAEICATSLYWKLSSSFDKHTTLQNALPLESPRFSPVTDFESAHGPVTRGSVFPLNASLRGLPHYTPSMASVSQGTPEAGSSSDYEVIFDNALKLYKMKTGRDLASDPLLRAFETFNLLIPSSPS